MTQRVSDQAGRPRRVLIADDNADSRLLIHTFLSLMGYEVCSAATGREAVSRAAQFRPEVVFLDLWMPEMDGIEACLELRKGPCPPPVPIFAVTADTLIAADIPPCFDRVLTKPVDLDGLAALLTKPGNPGLPPERRLH